MTKKYKAQIVYITEKQKVWLDKEAKKWGESQSQIVRSLINSRITKNI